MVLDADLVLAAEQRAAVDGAHRRNLRAEIALHRRRGARTMHAVVKMVPVSLVPVGHGAGPLAVPGWRGSLGDLIS